MITKPTLPPKAGYVEVIGPDGQRVYQRIPQPLDDTDAMVVDHEYRLALLELGLNENESEV